MKGDILREECNIEKEKEFWDAGIERTREGRVDETIKMRFSLVDGEERRKRARFDLISLNEPQNWLMIILVRREEEVGVYSDLTCYQLCPCYSSCMPKASLFARVSLSCSPRLPSLCNVLDVCETLGIDAEIRFS